MASLQLNELPRELLLEIFSRLRIDTLTELLRLTHTCKKWRQILLEEFRRPIGSFANISRYLLYRFPRENDEENAVIRPFLQREDGHSRPSFLMNQESTSINYKIRNCPLTSLSVTWWCRALSPHNPIPTTTMLILWHYHFGYLGVYSTDSRSSLSVVCTYTETYELRKVFAQESPVWTHCAIIVDEIEGLRWFVSGELVNASQLQSPLNKENATIVPHSTIWVGSNNGSLNWSGSLFDVAIWNRCLKPYEIRAMAKTRTELERVNFLSEFDEKLQDIQ